MPPPIFAHLGHWYVSLPVFMGPVLLLVIALKIQTWRERRPGSDETRRRSRVTVTDDATATTIAVAGVLDYPTVLEIEIELGDATRRSSELVLDLRGCTTADTESAWCLCDAVARAYASERVSTHVNADPSMRALRHALAAEGLTAVEAPADRA